MGGLHPRLGSVLIGLAVLFLAPCRPALATEQAPMVQVILDCSGSMVKRLPSGETRMEAAKMALANAAPQIPGHTLLALRAYGHQSGAGEKDCRDTQLLVGFAPAGQNAAPAVAKAEGLAPLGQTPITHVLEQAAADFPSDPIRDRVVILVSDGKETCAGDACAKAKELHQASRLIIHAVGLGVSKATQAQLECVARAGGGRYFSARNSNELAKAMVIAARTGQVLRHREEDLGHLRLAAAGRGDHRVTHARTGEEAGVLGGPRQSLALTPGPYLVAFGKAAWPVWIESGRRMALNPGVVSLKGARPAPCLIRDAQGREVGTVSAAMSSLALPPGDYTIDIKGNQESFSLKEGQRLELTH